MMNETLQVQYKDLQTEKTAWQEVTGTYQLTEGNWSCDCNRQAAFSLDEDDGFCLGNKRFIVVDVFYKEGRVMEDSMKQLIIKEANEGYPEP